MVFGRHRIWGDGEGEAVVGGGGGVEKLEVGKAEAKGEPWDSDTWWSVHLLRCFAFAFSFSWYFVYMYVYYLHFV